MHFGWVTKWSLDLAMKGNIKTRTKREEKQPQNKQSHCQQSRMPLSIRTGCLAQVHYAAARSN